MALFTVIDPAGRLVKLVRAPNGDEPTARELAAGKGRKRDERLLGHDGGFVVSQVEADGPDKVLWEVATATEVAAATDADAPASDEGSPVAGQEPDNRETL